MNQEKIGKIIKQIRKEHHLTQQEFAEKFGVTYQAVSKWENNKNIPDIAILKQICDTYNIDINDLLSVTIKKQDSKRKKITLFLISGLILLALLIIAFFLINKENSFELKELSSSCKNFTITGSIAYNKNKTAIHISNINYCGKKDMNIYKKMECILYEKENERKIKMAEYIYKKKSGSTIEELLKNIKFNVHDYIKTCKAYTEGSLELEINATNQKNQIITYKIPLKLEDNCIKN